MPRDLHNEKNGNKKPKNTLEQLIMPARWSNIS